MKKKFVQFFWYYILPILTHCSSLPLWKLRLWRWEEKVMVLISRNKNGQIYVSPIFYFILYVFMKSQNLGSHVLTYTHTYIIQKYFLVNEYMTTIMFLSSLNPQVILWLYEIKSTLEITYQHLPVPSFGEKKAGTWRPNPAAHNKRRSEDRAFPDSGKF